MRINFELNNNKVSIDTDPMRRLLDVLRDDFKLLSVKESCGEGECGACTVLWNDIPVTSCLINIIQVNDGKVMTAEAIAETKLGKLITKCFDENNAVQCGFCFPGFMVSSYAFLEHSPSAKIEDIKHALSGNICRCTGYKKIIEAVQLAASKIINEEIDLEI